MQVSVGRGGKDPTPVPLVTMAIHSMGDRTLQIEMTPGQVVHLIHALEAALPDPDTSGGAVIRSWLLRLIGHRCPTYRVQLLLLRQDGQWAPFVDAPASLLAIVNDYGVDHNWRSVLQGTVRLVVTETNPEGA
jgi:hypothetical protein